MLLRDLMWVYAQGTLGRIKRALKKTEVGLMDHHLKGGVVVSQ